jgi:hypothetical protein
MNAVKTGILISAVIFLFASTACCMDPSDEAAKDASVRMQAFLSLNHITEDQLKDIFEKGNNMPFTAAEEQLVQEMNSEITDYSTAYEIIDVLYYLADKYGMDMGQVSSVFLKRTARD